MEDRARGRKVLFVCTANVCRSPMAAPITSGARIGLEEVGVYPDGHRARQVDGAMLGPTSC